MNKLSAMETRRQQCDVLFQQLKQERSSFEAHWQEIADHVRPRRMRTSTSDANKGDKRNQKIVDNTATMASRTLRSGMMAGVTSPARNWKRLSHPDPKITELSAVKEWLNVVDSRMTDVFLKSNLYKVLPVVYGDMGDFAIGAMLVEEDFDDILRFMPLAIGSYYVANNDKLKVDVFAREFQMTVRQLLQKFGSKLPNGEYDFSNFSSEVKNLWENNQRETWVEVRHIIKPNDEYDEKKLQSKFKKYVSIYYETGKSANKSGYMMGAKDTYLRESGYDWFPVLAPRWEVTGEDVYGTDCPGMTALGDVKALMLMQKRKAQAVEKKINPAMVGTTALKGQKTSILPGDVTFTDDPQYGFRAAHEVNISIGELREDIQDHQERIKRAYFEDLFLMLATSDRRQITATEIDERKEEKLLALGPVLEQLNQDLLDPLIDITFKIMHDRSVDVNGQYIEGGLIPPPPEELKNADLKVEYISIMAQAQKLVGIGATERLFNFFSGMVQIFPDSMAKIDADQMLDVYAEQISAHTGLVRPDEEVQKIREQQAQAQQAQAQIEATQQMATTAKDLSQASLENDSALKRLFQASKAGSLV